MTMARKKTNQTVVKQPVKKTPVKRTPKSQQAVSPAQEELVSVSVAHQEQEPATITKEEIATVNHEESTFTAVMHEEIAVHEEVEILHHDEPVDTQKGIVASIMAFKESNEIQFYGIVAIAVFILIIIL
jgi:hypothetical protein